MASQNTPLLVHSLKVVLMSSGVVFLVILLSITLSPVVTSASSDIPNLVSTIRSWLRPPYLYVIINAIILTIAATSRLYHHHQSGPHPEMTPHAPTPKAATHVAPATYHHQQHVPADVISVHHPFQQLSPFDAVSLSYSSGIVSSAKDEVHHEVVEKRESGVGVVEEEAIVKKVVMVDDDERVDEKMIMEDEMEDKWTMMMTPQPKQLRRQQAVEFFSEKPPASARFGQHRRPATKASHSEGGKVLRRVAKPKPKKHDTLESTWKTITEGRHMPLTRHLKKSDTWENQGHQINLLDDADSLLGPVVKKAETFQDRTNYSPPPIPPPRLKKEPSLSQDDLNKRVEAFINKFNEEMRLQRQQSMQQFMEKINRGAY